MSDLTPNQWTILEALKDGARWLRSFHMVKPLIEDLIERGLVERCKPDGGRANNMARLTEAGCELLEIPFVPSVEAGTTHKKHEPSPPVGFALPKHMSERATRILRDGLEDAVRRIDGCERFKLPDGIAQAAILDGRPYTEFLCALMWMGLECWKDDRDAHRNLKAA